MFKQVVVAATLSIVAASSFAGPYSRFYPSEYVGLDAGSTRLDGKSDSQNSYGLFAGYEFARNFAFELGVRRLGEFDECCHKLKYDQTTVSFIGALPLTRDFSVFGRIGYSKLKITAEPPHVPTETDSSKLVGWGVSYAFSPTVSGRVEIQKPSNQISNVSMGVVIKY